MSKNKPNLSESAELLANAILKNCSVVEWASIRDFYCKVSREANYKVSNSNNFTLEIGQMYEYIEFSLSSLIVFSKLFGTEDINTDKSSSGGCESCDYVSDYCHTIYINNPTRFIDEIKELDGLDIVKCSS